MPGNKLALAVLCVASAVPFEKADRATHSLHAILFESYPFSLAAAFNLADLPSADFPLKFSRLFAPSRRPQSIEMPAGLRLPEHPMFMDIYTFSVTESQIRSKKTLSHTNGMQELDYKIRFLSWSKAGYQIELRGRHADFKWNPISVEGPIDRTKVVAIRHSANRALFLVLTPIDKTPEELLTEKEDLTHPKPISQPLPIYPEALRQSHREGMVRIRCIVTREGRVDAEKFVLLECPHYLFARGSLDAALNQWTFRPGTRRGVPVDVHATIEVAFRLR